MLSTHRARLPPELAGKTPAELESDWPAWVSRHNADIRVRLERGDEDSVVNFWLYGTTFTTLPRATQRDIGRANAADVLLGRLDDLLAKVAAPGADDRLLFVRHVLERRGVDPATDKGREVARQYLIELRERVLKDNARYRTVAQSAARLSNRDAELNTFATLYRDRGLSSDTSVNADYALDHAIEAMRATGRLGAGSIHRVAIIGPGLDFTDKAEGYDFYPEQTIQPFAVLDSLLRLGLANPETVRMTTFDLSPRVNQHLESARERAAAGQGYVVQLPLSADDPRHHWQPELVTYWQRVGRAIGEEVAPIAVPAGAGRVRVRALRVRPALVLSISPRDLNIVLERLEPSTADGAFDLIVATNVLLYYDPFEQALALTNVAAMLRPGGFFLTNYAMSPVAPLEPSAILTTTVSFDDQHNGDTLFWYRRQ
jgi:hypothetical protein